MPDTMKGRETEKDDAVKGREPFDPSDPFDIACELFRRGIAELSLEAMKIAVIRDLSREDQMRAMVGGSVAGVVGCAFAQIENTEDGRNAMMEYIAECLPFAREQAEGILDAAALSRQEAQG